MINEILEEFGPIKILIVEDEPVSAQLCHLYYEEAGFNTTIASDGNLALEMMGNELPDVVLCDRKMPEMPGSTLLQMIRNEGDEWQQIVFIFITGLDDRRDRYAMLELKPDGYICKPIAFSEVNKHIYLGLVQKRGFSF